MASCPSYNDDTPIEDMELMQKIHADCIDKKCCCNCRFLENACVDKTQSETYKSRAHWGKGGVWEHGYYLCSNPKTGLVYLGHQTEDNLMAKHGICPNYELNDFFTEMYSIEDKSIFK